MTIHAERVEIDLPERGVQLSVLDWGGDGPPLLLSHATGFCAALWEPVALELRGNFRVIGFDARGHGDASKPEHEGAYAWNEFVDDLRALVAELRARWQLPSFAYGIGHSFGGTVILAAAASDPHLLGRIALVDPVIMPIAAADIERLRASTNNNMAEIARKRRSLWPSRDVARESWSKKPPFQSWRPASLEIYLEHAMRSRDDDQAELKCSGEIEARVYEGIHGILPFEVAEKLTIPGLLIRAAEGSFPLEVYQQLVELAADLSLTELAGDHLLPMVNPDGLSALLNAFGDR